MNRQSSTLRLADPATTAVDADLQTVLRAWHDATVRWEQRQALLQAEVQRLTAQAKGDGNPSRGFGGHGDPGRVALQVAEGVRGKLIPVARHLSDLRPRVRDDAVACELLRKVEGGVAAAEALIDDVLELASDRVPLLRPVKLGSLVAEVQASLLPRLSAQGVMTTIDVADQVTVLADEEMLRRVVLQLTLNALDAMPRGGELVVTAYAGPRAVELEIADSGEGLPDEARTRVFDPFFTTKSGAQGLGLAIVRRLVEAHGGEVLAVNCPEGGAAFTLRLPRQALEAAA